MRQLVNDLFYETIGGYPDCVLDYILMEDDNPHQGKRSHWNAVALAMLKMIEGYIERQMKREIRLSAEHGRNAVSEKVAPWSFDMGKAKAHPIDAVLFLFVPEATVVDRYGTRVYDCEWSAMNDGGKIPYWYAFLEPPLGTAWVVRNGEKIRKSYDREDFEIVNRALFPQGIDELEVYEWTTDWSNYFDDGHEYWGAACWSIYDKSMNRYAVIMASATD